MSKLTKRIIIMSLTVAFIIVMAGCKSKKNPSVADIEAKMKPQVAFNDMLKLDASKLKRIYGINSEDLEDSFVYISNSNVKAKEIAVIKVKDEAKVKEVEDQINKRIEKQSNSFKDYVPDEYSLIQKHVMKHKGKYILFVVSENKDKLEETFDNSFK